MIALALAGAPAATHAADAGIGSSFKGPLGLQLYSLRDSFKTNVPGTMAKVQKFGFVNAELAGTYGMSADQFKAFLKQHGINAIAAHFGYEQWQKDPDGTAKQAADLGLKYVGCAWIPHDGPFDEKKCREAAAVFNKAGVATAKLGIKFFYHCHGYEFTAHGDGKLMDLLMAETDPMLVAFEMDIFWVVFPGEDPVKWLQKYPRRWQLMHLKDMKKGLKTGEATGHTDVSNDVAMGTGQMDMAAILKAAKKAGVKWYFIEDESPSVEQQIPVSLRYLESVKF